VRTVGVPFIFDPGQQCARLSGDELRDGISGARLVICNDYEFELIRQKTGLDEQQLLQHASALMITREKTAVQSTNRPRASTFLPLRRIASSIRQAWATRSAAD
jgi:hypothetical protein